MAKHDIGGYYYGKNVQKNVRGFIVYGDNGRKRTKLNGDLRRKLVYANGDLRYTSVRKVVFFYGTSCFQKKDI